MWPCTSKYISLASSQALEYGLFVFFHETENTVYRYLIAISRLRVRLGILTERGEGS